MTTLELIFRSQRLAVAATLGMLLGATEAGAQALFVTSTEGTYQQLPFGKAGDTIVITGGGFVSGQMSVFFNGTAASTVFVASSSQMNVTIAAGTPLGSGSVKVTRAPSSQTFSPNSFEVIGPQPYIVGFSPTVGSTSQQVDIEGVNYDVATGVQFDGIPAFAQQVGQNLIRATVPNPARSGLITITSTVGTGNSRSNFFAPNVVTNFSVTGSVVGTAVQVQGVNFLGASGVFFHSDVSAMFTNVSNTNLTAIVPAGARTGPVFVNTPAGGTPSSINFVIPPAITSFTPPGGGVGTSVSITGTTFFDVTSVMIGGTTAESFMTNAAGTNLTFPVPAGAVTGPIIVNTTSGSATSAVAFFLPPQISTVNPTQGRAGTNVTIAGVNFVGTTNVTFDGVNATFSNVTANSLTTTVPGGSLTGNIVIRTPGGAATNGPFQIQPLITGFSPTSGFPGTSVTISGTNFTASAFVRFSGSNAVVSGATLVQIIAQVPTNIPSGTITVLTDGGSDESVDTFTVLTINTNIHLGLRLTNNQTVVSWTTDSDGFLLQSATNLNPPINWTNVPGSPASNGGLFIVTNDTVPPGKFFRLLRP